MTFKVGDRVRTEDGDGVIISTKDGVFEVAISGENDWYYSSGEMELISGTPEEAIRNRPREHTDEQWQQYAEISSFEGNVRRITSQIADLLIEKNKAYGDSALNPIRVFSKSDRIEQLNVRIDDKISRIQRGSEYGNEDTEMDLIGYLVLRKIARESE